MTLDTLEARKAVTLRSLAHARRALEAAESEAAKRRHSRRVVVALDTLALLGQIARCDFGVRLQA